MTIETESQKKIDFAHFERMTMGDSSLQSEVLGLFREQGEIWRKLLDPSNPTPDFMVGAHTIKGSARSIGAWELADICGAAEEAARRSNLSRDEKYIWREQILNALEAVFDEIAQLEHRLALNSLKS